MKFETVVTDNTASKRALFMEFLGTFALVYVGGWAVILADIGAVNLVGVALAHMFVLGFMIYAGANISGANYNAAVTLGLWVTSHFGTFKLAAYCFAQFCGALVASLLIKLMLLGCDFEKDLPSSLGFPHPNTAAYGTFNCFLFEVIATFF